MVLGAALSETRMSPVRLLVASVVFALWASPTMAEPLNPEDAAGHIGETGHGLRCRGLRRIRGQ
jgi:hypothetical protein